MIFECPIIPKFCSCSRHIWNFYFEWWWRGEIKTNQHCKINTFFRDAQNSKSKGVYYLVYIYNLFFFYRNFYITKYNKLVNIYHCISVANSQCRNTIKNNSVECTHIFLQLNIYVDLVEFTIWRLYLNNGGHIIRRVYYLLSIMRLAGVVAPDKYFSWNKRPWDFYTSTWSRAKITKSWINTTGTWWTSQCCLELTGRGPPRSWASRWTLR